MKKPKLPYKDGWYDRFGTTVMSRGVTAIPKALHQDFRTELGLGFQHIALWLVISAKYRGTEIPRFKINWLVDALGLTPSYVRKLLRELKVKGLLRIIPLGRYEYELDLSPTNYTLDSLLTRNITDSPLDGP